MDLKDKAIKIKHKDKDTGQLIEKEYILVKDRVLEFNAKYPNGKINTELLSGETAEMIIFKAIVMPDTAKPERFFTGYSQATWGDGYINKSSAMENAETSAVGRALGFMGIGVIDAIASADEIKKEQTQPKKELKFDKLKFMVLVDGLKKKIPAEEYEKFCKKFEYEDGYQLSKIEVRAEAENYYTRLAGFVDEFLKAWDEPAKKANGELPY